MFASTQQPSETSSTTRNASEDWVQPMWGNLTEPLRLAMTRLNQEVPASDYCVKMTAEILRMRRQGAVGDTVRHAMQLFCAAEDLNALINQMQ